MRILVVDDDRAVRKSLRMTLEYEGYQVLVASNGWEGLAFIEHDVPDLVLLDIEMPGISGLDVLGRLHAMYEWLPVVIMSAGATSAIRAEAIRTGAFDVLEKPFASTDRLCATVRRAVGRARR